MENRKQMVLGWLIGYFVVLAPLNYYFASDLIWSFARAILGISIPIIILWRCKK